MQVPEMDASVVVVAGDEADLLPTALGHLELQSYPSARYEVIIVDAGAAGRASALLQRYVPGGPVPIRCVRAEAGVIAGRNAGLQAARGRWVIYLDVDLLAGPQLVERHVQGQVERGGTCAIVGGIDRHPQIDGRSFTRVYSLAGLYELGHVRRYIRNQPLRFPDWRTHHLSLPREIALKAGGFDETLPCAGLEDIELASRLEERGLHGYYSDTACAYVWRGVSLESEEARYYCEGYSLPRVLEQTGSDLLRRRMLPGISRTQAALHIPVAAGHALAGSLFADRQPSLSGFMRRALAYAFHQGYRDARRGRPPRMALQP